MKGMGGADHGISFGGGLWREEVLHWRGHIWRSKRSSRNCLVEFGCFLFLVLYTFPSAVVGGGWHSRLYYDSNEPRPHIHPTTASAHQFNADSFGRVLNEGRAFSDREDITNGLRLANRLLK